MSKPPTMRPSLSGHQSRASSINGIAKAKPLRTSFTSASVFLSLVSRERILKDRCFLVLLWRGFLLGISARALLLCGWPSSVFSCSLNYYFSLLSVFIPFLGEGVSFGYRMGGGFSFLFLNKNHKL